MNVVWQKYIKKKKEIKKGRKRQNDGQRKRKGKAK